MRRIPVVVLLVVSAVGFVTLNSRAQQTSEGTRKVLARVPPQYPHVAMTMSIRGSVKVDALVAANGNVKSTEVKGGHPLLAQAAQDAIHKWKWEPAAHETHELVEVKFDPQ